MVTTPDDGSCGIGTYTRDVQDALEGVQARSLFLDQDRRSVLEFLSLALRAIRSKSDVIHIQHEYGLFRRTWSPYPGIMGVVFFSALAVLNLFRDKSVIVTLHSVLNPSPHEAPLRVRLYLLLMHGLIARSADHLVFLSEAGKQRFLEDVALRSNEYSRLPHGVNVSKAVETTQAEAKAEFGFDPDDFVVMIPGFIRPPKGHDIFIEVADRLPEYEFLVAGGARPKGDDAEFAAEIEAAAGENVTVSGILEEEDFPLALNAADLAFLPYRVVSQSGTFNWCIAQELPVLASDVPYFTRIQDRWDVVETVDIQAVDDAVEQIQELLDSDDRLAELRRNSRRYKRANSFEQVARSHRRIYARVASDEGSRLPDPLDENDYRTQRAP
jgi:glycosyltransferase involved in cell wall biosynthesis